MDIEAPMKGGRAFPYRLLPLVIALPVLLAVGGRARQTPDTAAAVRAFVTPQGLETDARRIVEHDRLSGSDGENAAIDYIVTTLKNDGIAVQVDTFRAFTSDPLSATVELLGADGSTLLSPKAITVAFSASVRGLEAPVVDIGDASVLPDVQPATAGELALASNNSAPIGEVDATPATGAAASGQATSASRARFHQLAPTLRGAIVLVTGTPGPDEAWKLQQLGAAGAVFVNPADRLNDLVTTTVWGTPSLRDVHRIPRLPVAEVTHADGEAIRAQLARAGSRLRISAATRTGWKTLRLAVARIPGGAAPAADQPYVLFGGHIDAWYHGGTDEGASNAAMLELARAFHRQRANLRRGLVVAWWPGHSNGRYAGSTWFVDHNFIDLRDRAIAYLNVDGIGQKDARQYSTAVTASLQNLASDVVRTRAGTTQLRVGRPGRDSDESFNGVGIPLLQLNHNRLESDGGYWWWHTPDDTFDKIDFAVLKGDADLYADALTALLASPLPPISLSAEVEALGALIGQREAAAKGRLDLRLARERQLKLLAAVREIEQHLPAAGGAGIDLGMVRVLRPIYRVLYTLGGAYHPDPAVSFGLLPGLAEAGSLAATAAGSDAEGFMTVALLRERNRLIDALDASLAEAERLRAGLRLR
ncbi:MAG: M28 family metallopeptidase [Gemmatimonadaceae bacterium]